MCWQDCTQYATCEHRAPVGPREKCEWAGGQPDTVSCRSPRHRHDVYDNIVVGKCSACNGVAAGNGQLKAELEALNDAEVIAKRDRMRAEQAVKRAELEGSNPEFNRYCAFDLKTGQQRHYH